MKHDTIRKAETIPFTWDDPFLLDEQLTEEERLIQASARGFAQDVLQPRVIDAYREEIDAPELFPISCQWGGPKPSAGSSSVCPLDNRDGVPS